MVTSFDNLWPLSTFISLFCHFFTLFLHFSPLSLCFICRLLPVPPSLWSLTTSAATNCNYRNENDQQEATEFNTMYKGNFVCVQLHTLTTSSSRFYYVCITSQIIYYYLLKLSNCFRFFNIKAISFRLLFKFE